MSIDDKAHLLRFLHAPCFGLSPAQIMEIERVIDRKAVVDLTQARPYYTYDEAKALLSFGTTAGVRKLAKQGRLVAYVLPGRKQALGVTRQSLDALLAIRAQMDGEGPSRPSERRVAI